MCTAQVPFVDAKENSPLFFGQHRISFDITLIMIFLVFEPFLHEPRKNMSFRTKVDVLQCSLNTSTS